MASWHRRGGAGWTGARFSMATFTPSVCAREEASKGALLEQGALADARTGRALGIREVQAVVGDELGAHLGAVVEHPVERTVVLGRPDAEVVGGVEHEPQCAAPEHRSQRTRVASAAAAVGEHRARRDVDLEPAQARLFEGGHGAPGRPAVAVQVEAETLVHLADTFDAHPRGRVARR
jgi:hypothetical protein